MGLTGEFLSDGVQSVKISTGVDIVFVIDGTGSMGPLLDKVKENALNLHKSIVAGLSEVRRKVEELRIKVIVYRDYFVDTKAIETSERFFSIPFEEQDYADFINGIQPMGGGDEPESALEALYFALKSKWNNTHRKKRHITIIMTDASAHPLDDPQRFIDPQKIYPAEIPTSLSGLQGVWENRQSTLDYNGRRMAIYAPDRYPWNEIGNWSSVTFIPSEAGTGLLALDMDAVIQFIVKSI